MKQKRALDILLTVSKILLTVFLVLSLFYYAYFLIDAYIESANAQPQENGISIDPYPLAFAFVLIFSIITNGVCLLLSGLSLILSYLYRSSPNRKRNIKAFFIFLLLPLLLEALILLSGIFTGVLL